MRSRVRVLELFTIVSDLEKATQSVIDNVNKGGFFCLANVHMSVYSFLNQNFARVLNSATMVFPDGKPLWFIQRSIGFKSAHQIRGIELFYSLCEQSADLNLKIGFYGGCDNSVLCELKDRVLNDYPSAKIVYLFSPPFRELTDYETESVVVDIRETDVDILFVGIGCPKQEILMHKLSTKLSCPMVGVGAVFDFASGRKAEAPKWIRKVGLEWFFRLCCEPSRLWKRYLVYNSLFVFLFFMQRFFPSIYKQLIKMRKSKLQ